MPIISNLPTVTSITATDPLTTDLDTVHYTVTFSEAVSGVTADQFSLTSTGSIRGATITDVTPVAGSNGTSYIVTASTGSGNGTVGLTFTGTNVHDAGGNSVGSFASESTINYPAFHYVTAIAAGDLNGDGKADLVIESSNPTAIDVRLNDGNGNFISTGAVTSQIYLSAPELGDVNGDGKLDMIYTTLDGNSLYVRLGNGDGTFAAPSTYAPSANGELIEVADFNGDGKLDVLTWNSGIYTAIVLPGNGDGTFGPSIKTSTGTYTRFDGAADFNGDGKLDLLTYNYNDGTTALRLNNGDGTFGAATVLGKYLDFYTGDFNGDGKADLLATGGNTITVRFGNGDGTFAAPQGVLQTPVAVQSIGDADLNGDGKLDLVVVGINNTLYTYYGRGDGSFTAAGSLPLDPGAGGVTIADVNGDGKPDVIVGYANSSTTYLSGYDILTSNPSTPTAPVVYDIARAVPALTITDADVTPGADGNDYINAAHFHGGATTLVGTGNAGETITVTDAVTHAVIGTATVGGDGNWSLGVSGLQDGATYSYVATATDAQNNVSFGPSFTFTVDLTAPVLSITDIELSPDATLSNPLIDISGTTSTDGAWQLDEQAVPYGKTTLIAKLSDAAGNIGSSPPITFLKTYTTVAGEVLTNAVVVYNGGSIFVPGLTLASGSTSIGTTVFAQAVEEDRGGTSIGSVIKVGGVQHVYGGSVTGTKIEAGGYQDIRSGATATDSVLFGYQQLYAGGTAAHTTIKAGGQQFVVSGSHATNTVVELSGVAQIAAGGDEHGAMIYGIEYLSGSSYGATVRAGGIQYDYGSSNGDVVKNGGSQHIYQGGTAVGTSVEAGGYQDVYNGSTVNVTLAGNQQVVSGGKATGTTIESGGRQYVGWAAATSATTIATGGFQYVDGGATDSNAIVNGGFQFVAGTATGATVTGGGEQDVGAYGAASNTHLDGGVGHVYADGQLKNVDFGGTAGATLVLDRPWGFTGSIANFGADDRIDFRGTVISSVGVDSSNNLTVTTDGGQSYSWGLLAQYAASSFALSSDGVGGTLLTYQPPQQAQLAAAH